MSFWDDRYDRPDYVFGEAPNAFLAAQQSRFAGSRTALAVADGEGRNGVWLAEQGLEVLAIDASAIGLEKARRLAEKRGVSLTTRQLDIALYDWPAESFDVIAAIFIQFAPPPLRAVIFAGMVRALAPGGLLLLQGYRPEQLAYGTGGPSEADNLYSEPLLRGSFAGLEIVHLGVHDSVLAEGAGHSGPSALIDLVARKPREESRP